MKTKTKTKTKTAPRKFTLPVSESVIESNARLGQMLGEALERVRGERGTPNEDPVDALYRIVSERDELLNIVAVDRLRGERLMRGEIISVKFL